MTSRPLRVRFAPSPTGYLHIGGARTALFNYLYARQNGGVFVLRVEDTDRERSTPEAIAAILSGLRYLGLDWDEGPEKGGDHGPYFQSERLPRYAAYVERLLEARKAYRCFCSRERLDALRDSQKEAKGRIQYDRRCLGLAPAEVTRRQAAGEPSVARFLVPEGETVVRDLIRGDVCVQNAEVEDFVIQRTDGTCVYNFAVVGDDHEMEISHVIRGEDHLPNTPKQVLLFQALGFPVPEYAHIPLILAQGGGKLSKRHGAVSVMEYEEMGYLPEAMINFLARMGWSYDDREELFSIADLIEKFSFKGVSKSGAVYDLKKLQHLGGHYLRQRPLEDIVRMTAPRLVAAGLLTPEALERGRQRLALMISLERDRAENLSQIVEKVRFYFEPPRDLDAGALKALRKAKGCGPLLERYAASVASAVSEEAWRPDSPSTLEEHGRAFTATEGIGLGDLAQPLRCIVSGRSATPGLFEVLAILGRKATLERLANSGPLLAKAAGVDGEVAPRGRPASQ